MSRDIVVADSLEWCPENPEIGAVVTGIPDPAEFPEDGDLDPWGYFRKAARSAITVADEDAPVIFTQTDRKDDGQVSKARICMDVAEEEGLRLLWHKIALRRAPGKSDLYRPTYTHVLGFGPDSVGPGEAWPDVFDAGPRLYDNGTGLETAERIVRFAGKHHDTIVDPFAGRGTIPAMAEALGYDAIGVELLEEQAEYARKLTLEPAGVPEV